MSKETAAVTENYDENSIQVLEGLEAVRKRAKSRGFIYHSWLRQHYLKGQIFWAKKT